MLAFLRRLFRPAPRATAPAPAPPRSSGPAVAPARASGTALAVAPDTIPATAMDVTPDGSPPAPSAPAPVPDLPGALEVSLQELLAVRGAAWRDAAPPADAAAACALGEAVATGRADTVRQLPSAAREAMAVCDDPRAGAGDLARVCERDLAVAPALLRYANSVFFARPGQSPAASVREAVDRVGVAGVRSVLVDVTVAALLCGPKSRHAGLTAQLWAHGQRTAALARAVAPALGAPPERAYVAGLLHDVGKLVLLDRAGEPGVAGLSWPALRGALLQLHEPLGGLAVVRWGLGEDVAVAVATHHRTAVSAQAAVERDALGEAVFLAERVDHLVAAGEPVDLDALWAAGTLAGDRDRAASALARHLGPVLTLVEPAAA